MVRLLCTFVRARALFSLFLLLALAVPALAQQPAGSIAGTVVDPLGARVGGATVKLLQDSRAAKEATSDGSPSWSVWWDTNNRRLVF